MAAPRLILLALTGCALFAQSSPRCIRISAGDTKGAVYAPDSGPAPAIGALVIRRTAKTVRAFLSTNAIRVNDSMDEIGWCSSNNSVPCAVHRQQPCTACEVTPSQYSKRVENFYNHAGDGMNARL